MAHAAGDEMHISGEEKVQSNGTLYTGGWDHVIRALDDQTGKQRWRNKRQQRPIASLSVSCGKDGGTFLFAGSYDGTCRAIRTKDGSEVWKYSGHTQPVRAVCATALDPGGMRKKAVELENWVEMLTGIDLDGDGDVGIVDRVGVVFTGSEDGTICALEGSSGEPLWKHERHTRRVVEVTVCDGIVFSVADDQTTRAIDAKTGQELWCSRWAWGRHGPPPDRGSIWTKAVNWTEKKTGLDLDGDGDVGEIGGESKLLEKAINRVEQVTGVDIDRDGDVGLVTGADVALTESLRSLGLSDSAITADAGNSSHTLLSPHSGSCEHSPVANRSPLLLSPLPGSPNSPLPTTEELMRQLHGLPASPEFHRATKSPGTSHEDVHTPRDVVRARDAWEDAKSRVALLDATIAAEKELKSWMLESDGRDSGQLAERIIESRSRSDGVGPACSLAEQARTHVPSPSREQYAPASISIDVELRAAQREWEAAKEHATHLEAELVVVKDNVMVGQRREAHQKIVDRVSQKIYAIYRLKNPRKLADVPGGCPCALS
jgi:WD40 repeat protein